MEESQEDRYRPPQLAKGRPWLITTHKNGKANKLEKQLFLINNKSYIKTIPELHRNVIESAHQGWLLLRDRENGSLYSLWNPVTSKLIRLPELEHGYIVEPSACVITCSPDDVNNCVLVLFFDYGLVFSCRLPTLPQSSNWVKQYIELEGKAVDIRMAVVFEGVIYAYAWHYGRECNMFLCMTVANNCSNSITVETMPLESPHTFRALLHDTISYMVESCGALYFIGFFVKPDDYEYTVDLDIIKVLVWRLDFSKMEWVRVHYLRNRAFLLGNHCSSWCWAGTGVGAGAGTGVLIEENNIYLANGLKMHTYSLQDDSYSSLLPHPKLRNTFSSPTWLSWFVPSNHPSLSRELEEEQVSNEKTKRHENKNQELQALQTRTLLLELPAKILKSISKHMNLFDYMNFRATCKQIQKACPLAQWRANRSYPLFMVLKDSGGAYELIDPYENISRTISNVHYSPTVLSTIEFSKDGWLLVRYDGDHLKYLNPFTRVTYEYPI